MQASSSSIRCCELTVAAVPNLDYWNCKFRPLSRIITRIGFSILLVDLDRADLFATIGDSEDELERMKAVLRWSCMFRSSRYIGVLPQCLSISLEGSQVCQREGLQTIQ